MNIEYVNTKKYEIPKDIPKTTKIKYLTLLEKDLSKYIEIIYFCGKFMMYKQFYKLLSLLNPNRKEKSNVVIGNKIIKELTSLGFIGNEYFNQNKYLYLKKPAIALIDGDYNSGTRNNLMKSLKNDKFIISLLRAEYYLLNKEILHHRDMFDQLMHITKEVYLVIRKIGNKYNYSLSKIEALLNLKTYSEILKLLNSSPEYQYRLGIIRILWVDIGKIYNALLLQRQTILSTPHFLKIYSKETGEVVLHYIPTIVIFDVNKSDQYYQNKLNGLFHSFNNITGNHLRDIQNKYISSEENSMGHIGQNHIGYKILLIGYELNVLEKKKEIIDSEIGLINSPLMGPPDVIPFDLGQYLYHASRKDSSFRTRHNEMINNSILKQYIALQHKQGTKEENVEKDLSNDDRSSIDIINKLKN